MGSKSISDLDVMSWGPSSDDRVYVYDDIADKDGVQHLGIWSSVSDIAPFYLISGSGDIVEISAVQFSPGIYQVTYGKNRGNNNASYFHFEFQVLDTTHFRIRVYNRSPDNAAPFNIGQGIGDIISADVKFTPFVFCQLNLISKEVPSFDKSKHPNGVEFEYRAEDKTLMRNLATLTGASYNIAEARWNNHTGLINWFTTDNGNELMSILPYSIAYQARTPLNTNYRGNSSYIEIWKVD